MKTSLKESGSAKNYSTDKPCIVCGSTTENGNTFHHLKSRGSGGCDSDWNLMPLCLKHHNQVHSIGLKQFAMDYWAAGKWLISAGWEECPLRKKWVHA